MKKNISISVNILVCLLCLSLTFCVSVKDRSHVQRDKVVILSSDEGNSLAETLFKNPDTREFVLDFFDKRTGSRLISAQILANSIVYDVPADLAFAVAWKESRFTTDAVNKNAISIDRGLFQLNNFSFPWLNVKDFFDPELNTKLGISHLRYCLNQTEDEVVALAWYNAGGGRVSRGGAPKSTLYYISDIMDYREELKKELRKACLVEKNIRISF
ncbi:MAG: lytic transglycosylase domain-containing protein [Spirochaetales bacterium]|nr:lytic transglycosylase domain-containing protein [Spirochaetales bacterium]